METISKVNILLKLQNVNDDSFINKEGGETCIAASIPNDLIKAL